jgi:hypothetical protein
MSLNGMGLCSEGHYSTLGTIQYWWLAAKDGI